MGILLCEQNFRDVWIRNKSVRAEIGNILRTHTHTHAAKLVVEIITSFVLLITIASISINIGLLRIEPGQNLTCMLE